MFKTKINQYVPVPCTRAISDSWWLFFTDCPNLHLYTNTTAVAMANRHRATSMLAIVSTEGAGLCCPAPAWEVLEMVATVAARL